MLLHDVLAGRGSCFQLASECAGLSCKMAGFATVQFSARHVSHKNHREMAGAYQDFCSVYMSLQSDSLPSASFDHTTALGEKKRSG